MSRQRPIPNPRSSRELATARGSSGRAAAAAAAEAAVPTTNDVGDAVRRFIRFRGIVAGHLEDVAAPGSLGVQEVLYRVHALPVEFGARLGKAVRVLRVVANVVQFGGRNVDAG